MLKLFKLKIVYEVKSLKSLPVFVNILEKSKFHKDNNF